MLDYFFIFMMEIYQKQYFYLQRSKVYVSTILPRPHLWDYNTDYTIVADYLRLQILREKIIYIQLNTINNHIN